MVVLKCGNCPSKVESNRCCGVPMGANEDKLICSLCNKKVSVNYCCGNQMNIIC